MFDGMTQDDAKRIAGELAAGGASAEKIAHYLVERGVDPTTAESVAFEQTSSVDLNTLGIDTSAGPRYKRRRIAAFRIIHERQYVVGFAVLCLVVLFRFAAVLCDSQFPGQVVVGRILCGLLLVAIFGLVIYSFVYYRCPACKSPIGRRDLLDDSLHCKNCGARLL